MNQAMIIILILFAILLYYLVFHMPTSSAVYSSNSTKDIRSVQLYLESEDIVTYVKDSFARGMSDITLHEDIEGRNLSLHVADSRDLKRAIRLVKQLMQERG